MVNLRSPITVLDDTNTWRTDVIVGAPADGKPDALWVWRVQCVDGLAGDRQWVDLAAPLQMYLAANLVASRQMAAVTAPGASVPPLARASAPGPEPTLPPLPDVREWLDADAFCRAIEPHVNVIKDGRWRAFSMGPTTYVLCDLLTEVLSKIAPTDCLPRKPFLTAQSPAWHRLLRQATEWLTHKGVIAAGTLPPNLFGRSYRVVWSNGSTTRMSYTPLRTEALGDPKMFEARKKSRLRAIARVEPNVSWRNPA